GLSVTGLAIDGKRIFTSDVKDNIRVAERQDDGGYKWTQTWPLDKPKVDGSAHPAGRAIRDGKELWVTSTRGNSVQRLDLVSGKVLQVIPVGVAPFTVVFAGNTAYVSNWGGDPPGKEDPQAPSSKTLVRIDPRTGVANHGSVSVLAFSAGEWKQVKAITVG